MESSRPRSRPRGPLAALAYACIGCGAILMLAMSFGMLRQDLALFLGTSAFVVGGLLWGFADGGRAARVDRDQGPTVSGGAP